MMKPCQSYINQSIQKRGNTRDKREGPMSQKTKEPPKRENHKGNIKFPNPLLSLEAYQIRKGEDLAYQIKKGKDLLKGHLALKNPHLLQQHVSK
jgi:hypothetical protein